MAFRLSTALRNKLLAQRATANAVLVAASSLTFVDGAGGNDSITDTGSGLGIFSLVKSKNENIKCVYYFYLTLRFMLFKSF